MNNQLQYKNVFYDCQTFDADGEYITVILKNDIVEGVCKHIQCHDRFYCDALFGDYELCADIAEQIDTLIMEQAEEDDLTE